MKKYLVSEEHNGQRIDSWLALQLGQTRSQLRHILERSNLVVNGRTVSSHYLIKTGDEVELVAATPHAETAPVPVAPDSAALFAQVEIMADTPDYMVINKPAGLVMHQAAGVEGPSVVDWLLEKYPQVRSVGEDPERPGIVHRLDREVSGLVVLAKTQAAFDSLKEQFQKRTVTKYYVALVHGADLPLEGTINFKLERSSQGYKMAAKPINQSGKTALTLFTVLQRFHNYTLVKAQIKTGRTHQIRAHFSAYGHPVVGDDLYAVQKLRLLNKKLKMGRIFLVAVELAFNDLTGDRQSFTIDLPPDLQTILDALP